MNLIYQNSMKGLDDIDKKILSLLQVDARMSNKALALEVGLSASPTFERVKRLEKQGYIKSYKAVCDPKKLGLDLLAFCQVSLRDHSEEFILRFQKAVKDIDVIVSCYHVAGNYDYLLQIRIENMEAYQDFIVKTLARIPNVATVHSSFVMAEIKDQSPLAID